MVGIERKEIKSEEGRKAKAGDRELGTKERKKRNGVGTTRRTVCQRDRLKVFTMQSIVPSKGRHFEGGIFPKNTFLSFSRVEKQKTDGRACHLSRAGGTYNITYGKTVFKLNDVFSLGM
jgi:hypothetical protein